MAKESKLNKFGYTEIVDTFSDLIAAVVGFLATVKGGFNLMAFLQYALETYPTVREAVEDFGTFWNELTDLTGEEALDAAAQIKANAPNHPVADKMTQVITIAAVAYDFGADTIEKAGKIIGMAKELFK